MECCGAFPFGLLQLQLRLQFLDLELQPALDNLRHGFTLKGLDLLVELMDLLLQLQPLLLKFCDPVGLLLQRPKNLGLKATIEARWSYSLFISTRIF